jgi:hypothetical protein
VRAARLRAACAAAFSLLLAVALAAVADADAERGRGPGPAIASTSAPVARIAGSARTVYDWSKAACEPDDIFDLPARAFRDRRGRVHMFSSHFVNRRNSGRSIDRLKHHCHVVLQSRSDGNPADFADQEWISSVYSTDGRTVVALVHDEFQGDWQASLCPSGLRASCWYNAVTLAISHDGGRTFRHAAKPPHHLVAAIQDRYKPDEGMAGIFSPSNIVYRKANHHYYALALLVGYNGERGTCVMRTRRLTDPRSWRAWDGSGFGYRFQNPYGPSPATRSCTPVDHDNIQQMSQSLTYNTYLHKFVLVGTAATYDPVRNGPVWGIYFSVSRDLVHWSMRRLIKEAELIWTYRCGDRKPLLYPSLIDPSSNSRNFETTGRTPYLYYTRFNPESCQIGLNRDLVRVPIEFSK